MIKKLSPCITAVFAIMCLFSVYVGSAAAQDTVKSSARIERERLSRIMNPGANIEEFRQEYLSYLTELEDSMKLFNEIPEVRKKLNRSGLKPLATFAAAKVSITEISQEDLTKIRSLYAKFPGWRDLPQALINSELRQAIEVRIADRKTSGLVAKSATTDDCATAISKGITNTDISIAKGFEIAAGGVKEGFPTDGLTIAARIAPIAAHVATQVAVLTLETFKAIKDDCENNTFQAEIQQQLTDSTNTTATNISNSTSATATNIENSTSKTAKNIVNARDIITINDNTNTFNIQADIAKARTDILAEIQKSKATIIADARGNKDELKNLLLRTQIEADLSSTEGSTFVALYQIPSDVCFSSLNDKGIPQLLVMPDLPTVTIEQCGLLDLVRSIVSQTIAKVGVGTNAQSFFNQGEAQRAAGQYKAAYASYRKAYKAASK